MRICLFDRFFFFGRFGSTLRMRATPYEESRCTTQVAYPDHPTLHTPLETPSLATAGEFCVVHLIKRNSVRCAFPIAFGNVDVKQDDELCRLCWFFAGFFFIWVVSGSFELHAMRVEFQHPISGQVISFLHINCQLFH